MTTEEMEEVLKLANAGRPQVNQTMNFYAPIGEQIAHVDTLVAHFDKDMNMQVTHAENIADETKNLSSSFLWPQYTTQATEEDKRDFERFLKRLCTEKTKSMTHDIHSYLKIKEDTGIIERPSQINTEWEWVKEFGYPYQASAYYKP